jgi:hypothetical protein
LREFTSCNIIAIPRNPLFHEGRLMTNLPHC